MNPSQRPSSLQQQRILRHVNSTDTGTMFDLLTGPQLFDRVKELEAKQGGKTGDRPEWH